MTEIERRTILKASAWSVPIIAVAVATPLAAASTVPRVALSCTRIEGRGQPMYHVPYNDGSVEIVDQGTVNSDKELQALCRDKGPLS